jgi:hypothetical protein
VFCLVDADSLPTSSDAVACPNFSDLARRSRSSRILRDIGNRSGEVPALQTTNR